MEACPTRAPLTLRLTYRWSLHWALAVAVPWVSPRAVAVTLEQLPACADCGAKLKAAIAPTAIAATSNLLIAPLLIPDHGHSLSRLSKPYQIVARTRRLYSLVKFTAPLAAERGLHDLVVADRTCPPLLCVREVSEKSALHHTITNLIRPATEQSVRGFHAVALDGRAVEGTGLRKWVGTERLWQV